MLEEPCIIDGKHEAFDALKTHSPLQRRFQTEIILGHRQEVFQSVDQDLFNCGRWYVEFRGLIRASRPEKVAINAVKTAIVREYACRKRHRQIAVRMYERGRTILAASITPTVGAMAGQGLQGFPSNVQCLDLAKRNV